MPGSRRRAAQVVIDKDKKDAAVVKEKVLVQEASATEISERAGAIAADAQADLDKALPALAAAVQCLKELKKAHIDEVKALKKPPGGVRLTLEVACVFFEARRAASESTSSEDGDESYQQSESARPPRHHAGRAREETRPRRPLEENSRLRGAGRQKPAEQRGQVPGDAPGVR